MGLVALAFGARTALAQTSPAGFYATEIMEVASGLELAPDGRFRWMFTTGALDMSAEGRWRQDGNDVLLDTEPPVTPPRFELLGAGREDAPALVVRVQDARGRTPEYLDVEAEYESGAPGYAHLDEDAYRFTPAPGRRIVAIRVGSAGFRFWSELYPVPAEANLMRFRFFPGDLGRADFRGARATIEGDALTLPVLGGPVRYRRLTGEESAALQSAIAEIRAAAGMPAEAPAGARTAARDPAAPGAAAGPIEVAIGSEFDQAQAEAVEDQGIGLVLRYGAVDLRYRLGERTIDFGRVGGGPNLHVIVRTDATNRQAGDLLFSYQDRLLTLDEALARAQGFETWLRAGGFELRPTTSEWPEPDAFQVTGHARDNDAAFIASGAAIRSADWSSAAQMLADPAVGAMTMHLFTLRTGEIHATAYLDNVRQMAARELVEANPDLGGGREWLLRVTIVRETAHAGG